MAAKELMSQPQMNFFDYFQIASVAIFIFILVGKILYLRLSRNINPIAIGGQ